MSGPGAFEPSPAEEYIPAAIKGTGWTRGDALPSESKPGEDELWFIQAPGDVSVEGEKGEEEKTRQGRQGERQER